jgi:hypothetical protein
MLIGLPLLLVLLGSGTTGCNCDPEANDCQFEITGVSPNPEPQHAIRVWSGDNQVGPEGTALVEQIVGQYLEAGRAAPVNCIFEIEAGGGKLQAEHSTELGEEAGDRIIVVREDGLCRATWVMGKPGVGKVKLFFFHFLPAYGKGDGCNYDVDVPYGSGWWLNCGTNEYGFVRFSARAHGPAAKIVVRDGDGQTGEAGQPLAVRPRARVTDLDDNPVPGITVSFVATGGSGTPASPVDATTDNFGDAAMPVDWVLGRAVGPIFLESQSLQAIARDVPLLFFGNPAVFHATAQRPGPPPLVPARMELVSGDNQHTLAGSPAPVAVQVKVTSADGTPVPGVLVDFVPDRGSLAISPATTDADGIATPGTWRPGYGEAGTFHLTATARGDNIANNPLVFTATASIGEGGTNTLTLYNGTNVTANIFIEGEALAAGNSLGMSGSREVQIFTTVNTSVLVYAYVGGTRVTTVRCTVTAAAWQGSLRPLVALFREGSFYSLTCNNF